MTPCLNYTRPHRREDFCTRSGTVNPDQNALCPSWEAFLLRIMGNDQAMVDYLQRICGYMLTGLVREHVIFFGYGTGANGKSTFADVLLGILGTGPTGYAAVAPISTFTASMTDQHPTDLAMLRGVRCVIAYETEQGRTWAIAKLKMMTGGDVIPARFMRQDFFTYKPQFKVMILGNHKPVLNNVDEATKRRFHLIPFTVTIPEAERDPRLGEKLKAEYPAILHWMIQGTAAWQQQGLNPPPAVRDATSDYLANEDSIGAWIADRCRAGKGFYDTLVNLFASWKEWCIANGEDFGKSKQFAKALDARPDLTRRKQGGTARTGWDGIVVIPPEMPNYHQ
jgi:putative DNA primase/helicase